MDTKIILAILIVALIGIVAATYQNETSNVMSSLANVATEDSNPVESVTDIAEANGENHANSVQVDESIVQPDSSVNAKVVSTRRTSNSNDNQGVSIESNSNSASSNPSQQTNQGSSSQSTQGSSSQSTSQDTSIQTTNTTSTTQNTSTSAQRTNTSSSVSKISESEAMSIAKNSLSDGITSNYQKVSETTINGKPYYEVNLYQDGEIIGYAEIDATNGRVTGGATKGEAP